MVAISWYNTVAITEVLLHLDGYSFFIRILIGWVEV
jgi:hypothetical protein